MLFRSAVLDKPGPLDEDEWQLMRQHAAIGERILNADPVLHKDAVKYDEITYMEILRQGLKVMDLTAVSLCKDNDLPMIIFNMNQPGNIRRVVMGEKVGSLVKA